jgi:hypothetical protein
MTSKPLDLKGSVEISHVSGVEGPSLYMNQYRVAGPKPWGGGSTLGVWKTTARAVLLALASQPDVAFGVAAKAALVKLDLDQQLSISVDPTGITIGERHLVATMEKALGGRDTHAWKTTPRELVRALVGAPQPSEVTKGSLINTLPAAGWPAEYRRLETPILLARLFGGH